MTQDMQQQIKAAMVQAVKACLESIPSDTPDDKYPAIYTHAVEAAKNGATEALYDYCHGNQSRAAALGGLNRTTVRTNLKRAKRI